MDQKPRCPLCDKTHPIQFCKVFQSMSVKSRYDIIRRHKFCFNCLCKTHTIEWCTSQKTCNYCNKQHHTMLHILQPHETSTTRPVPLKAHSNSPTKRYVPQVKVPAAQRIGEKVTHHQVLLPTALVVLESPIKSQRIRVLINNGSAHSIILESLVRSNKLATVKVNGDEYCHIIIQSRFFSEQQVKLQCQIRTQLNIPLPSPVNDSRIRKTFGHLDLADPQFDFPTNVEVLIGAEASSLILRSGLYQPCSYLPVAQCTAFGWVLSGSCREY